MAIQWTVFLALILAHLLYDFHWQGSFIAEKKGESVFILLVHATTWALLLSFVLLFFGVFAWYKLVLLLATHAVIDNWKARLPKTPEYWQAIYVDQALHFITIVVVWLV